MLLPEKLPDPDFEELRSAVYDYMMDLANRNPFNEGSHRKFIFEKAVEAVYGKQIWTWVSSISEPPRSPIDDTPTVPSTEPPAAHLDVPEDIAALIRWRDTLSDKYGEDLVFHVVHVLATWRPGHPPELPPEHRAALTAFQQLDEGLQLDYVEAILGA